MSFATFIAKRLYRDTEGGKQVSRPAILIALTGIAIGLAVMIITVSIVVGFKREVRDKVVGFGSHIQISNVNATRSYDSRPVQVSDSLLTALSHYPEVSHVQRFSTKLGMIKTATDFQGIVLKGVGQEFDPTFFRQHLVEGE
ncbi:MAG: ABC transporter permease, partial [Mediterranea sp.]|nr:ABC transporter permease [Mediterranea sp.]